MNYYFECKLKVITPLFMGGAKQQPELRTQSINGLLRWWFRVAGGSFEDEKRIFGWAGETSNQGLVRIYIKDFDKLQKQKLSKEFDNSGRVRQDRGINYLGFSLYQRFRRDQTDRSQREYIKEIQTFDIRVSFHPKSTEEDVKKFFCALWLAFNLGNFGSRARRGFGSIKIESIKENEKDITNNCYGLNFVPERNLKDWVTNNLNTIEKILKLEPRPDIPYLFYNFEIWEFKKGSNWLNLLDEAGNEYKNFRRNRNLNDRIVFGLPIVTVGRYRSLRRASPLIFKVLEINKNNYALFFIIMKPNKRYFIFHPDIKNINWNLLDDFISSLQSHNLIRRIYPCLNSQ